MKKRRTAGKAAPFKRTLVPDLVGRGPFDEITRAELVALVAERTPRDNADDEATVRNKVNSRVYYAIEHTRTLRRGTSGHFLLGDVADCTATGIPVTFDDLPRYPRTASAMMTEASDTLSASACALPQSLDLAHQQILELNQRIRVLEQTLAATQRKLEKDVPLAERWRATQEKKRGPRAK